MRACVLVACVLVACSAPDHTIRSWHLEAATSPEVTLPRNLRSMLGTNANVVLRADVPLVPELQGQTLTLVVPCFHGALALAAGDRTITEDGLLWAGEHRFVIPASSSAGSTLALKLRVIGAEDPAAGLLVAPYLEAGADRRPGAAARVNFYVAVGALGVVVFLAGLYGVIYLLDRRRREHAAFVAMTLALVPICLQQLGQLWPIMGTYSWSIVGASAAMFLGAGIYFIHFAFQVDRPPRAWIAVLVLDTIANLLGARAGLITSIVNTPVMLVGYGYGLVLIVWLARSGERRADARLALVGWVVAVALALAEVAEGVAGDRIAGIHLTAISVVAFAVPHALMLARQQVARRQALELTALELQRQIAERSRELSAALASLAQRARSLELGNTIDGRYRIVAERGGGGTSSVYEVVRATDGEPLALKILKGHVAPAVMARFAREAQIAAALDHPNLVPVIDVGITDGAMFVVMPLVAGGSLEQQRERFGDPAWATPLLVQIATGLAALHDQGIVHRDLKPANILLAGGTAKISDFGVASLRAGDALEATTLHATPAPGTPLTRAGDVVGTPGYMAPELAVGAVTPAVDVFAFGVIAHELLLGRSPSELPFDGKFRTLVEQCLDPDPARRPDARALVRGLDVAG